MSQNISLTSSWTVNHAGNALEVTDALGRKTSIRYDKAGRPNAWAQASGATHTLTYNLRGLLAKQTDAAGHTTEYRYDGSRQTATLMPTYAERQLLDIQGRVIQTLTEADNDLIQQQRHYQYDARGNPVLHTDAENHQTRTEYDALNRTTRMTDARGGVTLFTYDSRGNLITVTDPQGSTTTFAYDAADRLISETYPGGQVRSYTHYPNGQRNTDTNPKGEITHYSYDDAGQLITVTYFANATALQNNQPGKTVNFAYNDLGQLTSYSDGVTSGSYGYDAIGQLITVTVNYGPFSKSHSYTYDADGRKHTYTNPEGVTYTYNYTANGDFQSLTIPNEGTIAVTAYKWRAPAEWLFPGGTRIVTDTDGLLRPSQTGLLDPGNNPRASRLYLYNDENHITGIQTEEGVHHYTLDELYRLTAAAYQYNDALEQQAQQQQAQQGLTTLLDDEHYSYDGVGNRLTENHGEPWDYNVNHQLQSRPEDITYSYDANGHTLSKTEGAEITTYEYDIAERLSAVKHNGVTQGSYQYDPFGRRVKKTTAAGTVYFHYDDTGLLAEYSASGQLIAEYQYTPGSTWMTNPLFRRDGTSNTVHYYYNGHLGQPLKLFTRTGQITWAAQWQAFGSLVITTEQVVNNLRFPGQYYDSESGLYQNYHRDYDSRTGRYVQRDPIGLDGGLNAYIYAEGSPIDRVDPLGLWSLNPSPSQASGLRVQAEADRRRRAAMAAKASLPPGGASASLGVGAGYHTGPVGAQGDAGIITDGSTVCVYVRVCGTAGAGLWGSAGATGGVGGGGGPLCSGTYGTYGVAGAGGKGLVGSGSAERGFGKNGGGSIGGGLGGLGGLGGGLTAVQLRAHTP